MSRHSTPVRTENNESLRSAAAGAAAIEVSPRAGGDVSTITDACPFPVRYFDSIDSTSREARRLIDRDPPAAATVLLAACQTGGVGRLGRAWSSPRGGLWLTMVMPLGADYNITAETALLHIRLAVAVRESIASEQAATLALEPVTIKWPNDIMVAARREGGSGSTPRGGEASERKAAGILTEIVRSSGGGAQAFLLVGVGINSNFASSELPEILRETAITLREAFGASVDQRRLLGNTVRSVLRASLPAADAEARAVRDAIALNLARRCLYRMKRSITITLPDGSQASGVLTGLSHDGRPILERADSSLWSPPVGSGETVIETPGARG